MYKLLIKIMIWRLWWSIGIASRIIKLDTTELSGQLHAWDDSTQGRVPPHTHDEVAG